MKQSVEKATFSRYPPFRQSEEHPETRPAPGERSAPGRGGVGKLVLGIALLLAGTPAYGGDPPAFRFSLLRVGDIKPAGWIRNQMLSDLRGSAGHLDQLTRRAQTDIFGLEKVTSSQEKPADAAAIGPKTWWDGETVGNWMEALARTAILTGDAQAAAKVQSFMDHILETRGDEGYLGIYPPQTRFRHEGENGELWTQSRLFLAMLAYYEGTGRRDIYDAVERAARLTISRYGPGHSYFNNRREGAGGVSHGLMFVDVMEWLFRLTNDQAFRDFGRFCYEDFSRGNTPRDRDAVLANLLDPARPFIDHTPHTLEHLRVPLWLYSLTEEPSYLRAFQNGFAKTRRYLTPSGACIGDENIFARAPTPDLPYEYCGMFELMFSALSALEKTADAGFAEMAEKVALNAAQGARFPDGTGVCYLARDNRYWATAADGYNGRLKYSPTHEDIAVCCNPNSAKLMPYYVQNMWMRVQAPDPGIAALLYGPAELTTDIKGVRVRIEEVTDYPFSERVSFRLHPERNVAFPLILRVPRWSKHADIHAPGARLRRAGEYIIATREWRENDEVAVTFRAEIQPLPAANGETAISRGPLVYALPIREERWVLKTYGINGFADYDIVPALADPVPMHGLFRVGSFRGVLNWANPPAGANPAFRNIAIATRAPLRYRMKAGKGVYTVVFGFCEGLHESAGRRVLELKIENAVRRKVDPAGEFGQNVPAAIALTAKDANGDGWLDVEVAASDSGRDRNAILNVLWIFDGDQEPPLEDIISGAFGRPPVAGLNCGPIPEDVSRWNFRLDGNRDGYGFVLREDLESDRMHPWHGSPLRLEGALIDCSGRPAKVSLLPIGCTVLRRVTFPVRSAARPASPR